jgi:hypothetical protein
MNSRRAAGALALLASDVAAVLLLRPWFNGGSDAQFWTALVVSGALTLASIGYAVGLLPARRVT